MGRIPKEVDFEAETRERLDALRARVGQSVPLDCKYVQEPHPILLAIGLVRKNHTCLPLSPIEILKNYAKLLRVTS